MRVFMTGATGFIGSYVAAELLAHGHELVYIARNPDKASFLRAHPRARCVPATLYDREAIVAALTGVEACVHVALGWGDTPLEMLEKDSSPSVFLLESAAAAAAEQFIYTSSTAALGPFFDGMSERDPLRPVDYYGATKAATEAYVLAAGAKTRMRCNVIRPGYTFGNPIAEGATTQPDRRFHEIAKKALAGEDITLKAGDGTQFAWAGDLARLYRALLESQRNREVYYGLARPFVTWEAIAKRAIALTGSRSRVLLEGSAEAPKLFDLRKIQQHFGLEFESEVEIDNHLRYLFSAHA